MNLTTYLASEVSENAVTYNVYRDTSKRDYGSGELTKVDAVEVWVFDPTSSSQVVVEGSGQETSYIGFAISDFDANGDVVHHVEVNDELRVASDESKRYEVRVKDALPNDTDPELWRMGLERANPS